MGTEVDIRVISQCEHLPQSDTVTPHVPLRGELEAGQALRGVPVDWEIVGASLGLVIVRFLHLLPGQAKVGDLDLFSGDQQDVPGSQVTMDDLSFLLMMVVVIIIITYLDTLKEDKPLFQNVYVQRLSFVSKGCKVFV